jgi:hypothetical protein
VVSALDPLLAFYNKDSYINEPLEHPIPMGPSMISPSQSHQGPFNSIDNQLVAGINTWMNSFVAEGAMGIIGRTDGLLILLYFLAGLDCFIRSPYAATLGKSNCPLIIVREKDDEISKAMVDLRRKFQWIPHFHTLPFVFEFAISRSELKIFETDISRTSREIFSANLNNLGERWSCVIAAVNVARVLKHFIAKRLFIPLTLPLHVWHQRGSTKSIRLGLRFVEVMFANNEEGRFLFEKLSLFYENTKHIPHLETLLPPGAESPIISAFQLFRLVPVGLQRQPLDVLELVTALEQLSTCIIQLHEANYVHGDIRWSNVVSDDKGTWYLIDCTQATSLNDARGLELLSTILKPVYVMDGAVPWSPRQDYYQLGLLIDQCVVSRSDPGVFHPLKVLLLDTPVHTSISPQEIIQAFLLVRSQILLPKV